MSGHRVLAATVFVTEEDGTVTEHPAGSSPPAAVAKRITNPAAWVPDEEPDDGGVSSSGASGRSG